ncbi:acetyltransferase-like isoleucine patch superfamily enzyme [Azospirillum sp. OGB3]|nr:acetyltransferase-like isoleucine patch superfamily enzyme [Azospirillum sp. OGB3]
MSLVPVSEELKKALTEAGVANFWTPGMTNVPLAATFEPPCHVQWMNWAYSGSMGAFSYGVSGYFFGARIGRYCSFGESIQCGRGNHPMDWLSTSPFQYMNDFRFPVGQGWPQADLYRSYSVPPQPNSNLHGPKDTVIGNDVWIGHGAFIKMGVTIGDGAVIGACAVVTRDVPPYSIVVGNPAVVKRLRFPEKTVEKLLAVKWWDYAPWDLTDISFADVDMAIDQIQQKKESNLIAPYQAELVTVESILASISNSNALSAGA